jgi:hypothetical protein
LRQTAIFASVFKLICLVQIRQQKYSASHPSEISGFFAPFRARKRGVSRSSRTLGAGCGGRSGGALTSGANADGEVVWFWRPDAGAKVVE